MRQLGLGSYPSAALIDAHGEIVYLGHPSSIGEDLVQSAIEGAIPRPIFDWSKELSKAVKAIRKGKLDAAVKEAEKLGEEGAEALASLRTIIDGRVGALEAAAEAGDWLRLDTQGPALTKALGKLPEAEKVDGLLDALKGDKGAQKVLKAQKKVAKILSEPVKKAQRGKVIRDLEKIIEKHGGTAAARDAEAAIKRINKSKR